jgi:hypothetical protein
MDTDSALYTLDVEMKGLRARRRERLLELDEVERRLPATTGPVHVVENVVFHLYRKIND